MINELSQTLNDMIDDGHCVFYHFLQNVKYSVIDICHLINEIGLQTPSYKIKYIKIGSNC